MTSYNADTGILCPRCNKYHRHDAFVYKNQRMEFCSACRHSISSAKFLREMNSFKKSDDWKRCLEYWGHRCAVCGKSESDGYHLAPDHWQPYRLNNGVNGLENSTVVTNIVPLCHAGMGARSNPANRATGCNNLKSGKLPDKWLRQYLGEELAIKKLQEIEKYFEDIVKFQRGRPARIPIES